MPEVANPYRPPVEPASPLPSTPELESERLSQFRAEGHVRAMGELGYFNTLVAIVLLLDALTGRATSEPPVRRALVVLGSLVSTLLCARAARMLRRIDRVGRSALIAASALLTVTTVLARGWPWLGLVGVGFGVLSTLLPLVLWDQSFRHVFSDAYQNDTLPRTRRLVAPAANWFLGSIGLIVVTWGWLNRFELLQKFLNLR